MLTKWLNTRETGWIPLESQRAYAISLQQIQAGNIDLFHLKMKEQIETGQKQDKIDYEQSYIFLRSRTQRDGKIMQITTVNDEGLRSRPDRVKSRARN